MIFCIIIFLNSISDRFFFASNIIATSFPTIYLFFGSSVFKTCNIIFATSVGDVACSCIMSISFWSLSKDGEYGDPFLADCSEMVQLLKKFVLITPGSMMITFIPKGDSSYVNDSLKPSTANFVLT